MRRGKSGNWKESQKRVISLVVTFKLYPGRKRCVAVREKFGHSLEKTTNSGGKDHSY